MPDENSKKQVLHEIIANQLREEIIQGWRGPGTPLVEMEIAAALNSSRNPVREALRRLEAEGYVESRRDRGAIVARPDPADINGLLQVRGVLEPLAARLAAEHRTEEQFARLAAIMAEAEEGLGAGNFSQLSALNSEFHLLIAESSANRSAASMISQLLAKVMWTYGPAAAIRGPHSWKEHANIVAAIEHRDGDMAEALMKDHIGCAAADFKARNALRPSTPNLKEH